jgi:hypothetical protein
MEQQVRPPYVTFEVRSVEDRAASMTAGHFVGKDVNYAIVTPSGSKDRIEKIAEEWLDGMAEGVRQERIPGEWLEAYTRKYKIWCETREVPEDGTPIMSWPALSPSQAKAILDANVRTLEDLVAANESTLAAIGMGARALKEKAKAWLDSADTTGKTAEELNDLRQQVQTLTKSVETLTKAKEKAEAALEASQDEKDS